MDLNEYLAGRHGLTTSQLATAINVKSPLQVRQWRHKYGNRKPGAENCVAIERATGGKVRRWDLRPTDWHRIWPEIVGTEGAPPLPVEPATSEG